MVLLISIKSFCQQGERPEVSAETSWKEALGYLATIGASAGMGALCGYYDAMHVGLVADKATRYINSISCSKERFEKGLPDFYSNHAGGLAFNGSISCLMWFSAWYTRVSLIKGIREETQRSWIKRSLGMASFLATWTAYAVCYSILRKDPVALNRHNFKNWK